MEYNRNKYLKDFLLFLFGKFKENQIDFLILRNFRDLPEKLRDGGDIDFILSNSSYGRIYDVLSNIKGLDILISSKRTVVHEFVVRYEEKLFIKLDFHPFEDWHGAIYFYAADVFADSQPYKMFNVPSEFHQAITMLFASYLYGGFIKQKYMEFAKPVLGDSEKLYSLTSIFGASNIKAIHDFGKGIVSDKELLKKRKSMLAHLIRYNVRKSGFVFLLRFLQTRVDELKLRVKYNGVIICLRTNDNKKALANLRSFLHGFLGDDRVCVLDESTNLIRVLKSWDDVGRLKVIVYDNCNSLLIRRPDLTVTDDNAICRDLINFLIKRNHKYNEE